MTNQYLEVAKLAAEEGGKTFRKYFGQAVGVKRKNHNKRNLVTKADIEIEARIKKLICKKFPHHQFLGEESGEAAVKQKQSYHWYIDPIDGTSNFIQGVPLCCISVALWDRNGPLVGVIYNPIMDQMYWAMRGQGTFLNGKKVSVSGVKNLSDAFGALGWSEAVSNGKKIFDLLAPAVRKSRIFGTTAWQLCYVAHGLCDFYAVTHIKIWDIAAGILMVKEAGGAVTDWKGQSPSATTTSLLASNKYINRQLQNKVKNF